MPLSFSGVLARPFWRMASTLVEPVDAGGADIVKCVYYEEERVRR
jgi:hypothetical protein